MFFLPFLIWFSVELKTSEEQSLLTETRCSPRYLSCYNHFSRTCRRAVLWETLTEYWFSHILEHFEFQLITKIKAKSLSSCFFFFFFPWESPRFLISIPLTVAAIESAFQRQGSVGGVGRFHFLKPDLKLFSEQRILREGKDCRIWFRGFLSRRKILPIVVLVWAEGGAGLELRGPASNRSLLLCPPRRPWRTWCTLTSSPMSGAPRSWLWAVPSAWTPSAGRPNPSSPASSCDPPEHRRGQIRPRWRRTRLAIKGGSYISVRPLPQLSDFLRRGLRNPYWGLSIFIGQYNMHLYSHVLGKVICLRCPWGYF